MTVSEVLLYFNKITNKMYTSFEVCTEVSVKITESWYVPPTGLVEM
jgi:hypothetical protein